MHDYDVCIYIWTIGYKWETLDICICSYGGGLLRIEGFNQNQRYGAWIENVQNQQKDQFLSLGDWNGNSFWIGKKKA